MFKQVVALCVFMCCVNSTFAQPAPINRKQFFLSDSIINVELTTDIRKLRSVKKKPEWLPAHIVMNFGDTLSISENIQLEPRGAYRKENCDIASLMLNFNTKESPKLANLKKLKLVGGCHHDIISDELLLREFLTYRIYNFLSVMSFKVRLLHVTYKDSKGKVNSYTQYAFLIEDIKDLASRNNCKEIKGRKFFTEATNRQHVNFVSIFQYMIGNTDWAIPNYHNIKLLVPKTDTLAKPYPVPYDFDYCGIVNASYAIPDENLDIKNVRERFYRGYERNMEEIQLSLDVFMEKKDVILKYIDEFYLLSPADRKDVSKFIKEFYAIIEDKRDVREHFIYKALH